MTRMIFRDAVVNTRVREKRDLHGEQKVDENHKKYSGIFVTNVKKMDGTEENNAIDQSMGAYTEGCVVP